MVLVIMEAGGGVAWDHLQNICQELWLRVMSSIESDTVKDFLKTIQQEKLCSWCGAYFLLRLVYHMRYLHSLKSAWHEAFHEQKILSYSLKLLLW